MNPDKFETDWEPTDPKVVAARRRTIDETVAQPATLAVEKEVDDEGTGSTDRPAAGG